MNSGMSFSGWWYGPYVFEPRVTTASTPWVTTYDRTSSSPAALAAAYGERGASGSVSTERPVSTEP